MKQKISITLEDDLLKVIEGKRGDMDRSSYIESALKHHVGSRSPLKDYSVRVISPVN